MTATPTTHDITMHSDEEIEAAYAAMIEQQRAEMRKKRDDRRYINARRYDYLIRAYDGDVVVAFADREFPSISDSERARVLAQHILAAADAADEQIKAVDAWRAAMAAKTATWEDRPEEAEYFAAVRWVDAREVAE